MGALIIEPQPEAQGQARLPASRLKVYRSSVRGPVNGDLLTVTLFGDTVPGLVAGLRLTRSQVVVLSNALDDFLAGDAIEDERA
jgi:hypothetical protein